MSGRPSYFFLEETCLLQLSITYVVDNEMLKHTPAFQILLFSSMLMVIQISNQANRDSIFSSAAPGFEKRPVEFKYLY